MFCGECGTENPDTNKFCKNCGKPLRQNSAAAPAAPFAPEVSVPAPPLPGVPAAPGTATPPAAVPPGNKGLFALALIGIAAAVAGWFRYPYLLGILAIVLGGVVILKSEKKKGAGFIIAVLAIIIGLACILSDLLYLMIFPPGIPSL